MVYQKGYIYLALTYNVQGSLNHIKTSGAHNKLVGRAHSTLLFPSSLPPSLFSVVHLKQLWATQQTLPFPLPTLCGLPGTATKLFPFFPPSAVLCSSPGAALGDPTDSPFLPSSHSPSVAHLALFQASQQTIPFSSPHHTLWLT